MGLITNILCLDILVVPKIPNIYGIIARSIRSQLPLGGNDLRNIYLDYQGLGKAWRP